MSERFAAVVRQNLRREQVSQDQKYVRSALKRLQLESIFYQLLNKYNDGVCVKLNRYDCVARFFVGSRYLVRVVNFAGSDKLRHIQTVALVSWPVTIELDNFMFQVAIFCVLFLTTTLRQATMNVPVAKVVLGSFESCFLLYMTSAAAIAFYCSSRLPPTTRAMEMTFLFIVWLYEVTADAMPRAKWSKVFCLCVIWLFLLRIIERVYNSDLYDHDVSKIPFFGEAIHINWLSLLTQSVSTLLVFVAKDIVYEYWYPNMSRFISAPVNFIYKPPFVEALENKAISKELAEEMAEERRSLRSRTRIYDMPIPRDGFMMALTSLGLSQTITAETFQQMSGVSAVQVQRAQFIKVWKPCVKKNPLPLMQLDQALLNDTARVWDALVDWSRGLLALRTLQRRFRARRPLLARVRKIALDRASEIRKERLSRNTESSLSCRTSTLHVARVSSQGSEREGTAASGRSAPSRKSRDESAFDAAATVGDEERESRVAAEDRSALALAIEEPPQEADVAAGAVITSAQRQQALVAARTLAKEAAPPGARLRGSAIAARGDVQVAKPGPQARGCEAPR